jgi:hypothetical protein
MNRVLMLCLYVLYFSADLLIALDKDNSHTLSKQELREYGDGTLTEIFIERGRNYYQSFNSGVNFCQTSYHAC